MKLLLDENLSPKLIRRLADVFPGSVHVHDCGLGNTDDAEIWKYAADGGFTVVSKDSDFYDRSVLHGHPPKVIQLRVGNCSTIEIETLLRSHVELMSHFERTDDESVLILP